MTTTADAPTRVHCPYCGRLVALTPLGYLYRHKTPSRLNWCSRSGGRPN